MVKLLGYNRRVQLGVVLLIAVVLIAGFVIVTWAHRCAPPRGKGDKIAFDNWRDIYVMDADGSNICRLTYDEADNTNPTWSPDGKQLAFFSSRDRSEGINGSRGIYIMEADGSNVRSVRAASRPYGYGDQGLDWSADGKYLAFVARYDPFGLFVMDVDGSNVRHVTDRAVDGRVSWSPDGKSIALVTSLVERITQVAIVEANGSNLRIVADERMAGIADYQNPAWSPDGQQIALDRLNKICLVNADGSNGRCLDVSPTHHGFKRYPTWSPDSQRIAFYSSDFDDNDNDGIYVMNADGSNVSRLISGASFIWGAANLAWSP